MSNFGNQCARRYRGHGEWNVSMTQGQATGLLRPACQSPEENAEALIQRTVRVVDVRREATVNCGLVAQGRVLGVPGLA